MRRLITTVAALALTTGAAFAQTQTAPSSADKPGASGQSQTTDPKQSSPGATGAMDNATGGVATSPQDVQKQGGAATAPGHDKGQGGAATGAGAGGSK